jgi:hypothetical protein
VLELDLAPVRSPRQACSIRMTASRAAVAAAGDCSKHVEEV